MFFAFFSYLITNPYEGAEKVTEESANQLQAIVPHSVPKIVPQSL